MTTTNNTTAETITFSQIKSLRAEALTAGDYDQAAICDLAIEGEIDADDYTTLSAKGARTLRTMTREQAYAECARVISDAEVQS